MLQGLAPFKEMRRATEDLEVVRMCRLYLKTSGFIKNGRELAVPSQSTCSLKCG